MQKLCPLIQIPFMNGIQGMGGLRMILAGEVSEMYEMLFTFESQLRGDFKLQVCKCEHRELMLHAVKTSQDHFFIFGFSC